MEDFNRAGQLPDTHTVIGTLQGTPGEGTSSVETPTLRFLHRLLKEAPDLEKEMAKLQQKGQEEPGTREEGNGKEREVEKAQTQSKGKAQAISITASENNVVREQKEEIARLEQQLRTLQEEKRNTEKEKTKKRARNEPPLEVEEEDIEEGPWYEATDTSMWERKRVPKKTRANPFAGEILMDPLSTHFKPITYEYDGTTDPEEYVSKFENMSLLHQYTEGVKCQVFSTTLVGGAQQWFQQLPAESITSFEELYEAFIRQFASANKSTKTSLHLMAVKQTPGESLREYVAKFNMVALEIPGVDEKVKVHAFIQGLKAEAFFDSLVMSEPVGFGDLLKRITPHIHLEEAKSARREGSEKKGKKSDRRGNGEEEKDRRGAEQMSGMGYKGRYDNRPRGYIPPHMQERAPVYNRDHRVGYNTRMVNEVSEQRLIPLNRSLSDILVVARRLPSFRVPGYVTPDIKGTPNSLICHYHNQNGRMTVDQLVREGQLQEFVKREGRDAPRRHDRKQHNGGGDHPPPPPAGSPKNTIYMISGGERGNISNRTRKMAVRAAGRKENEVMEIGTEGEAEITFGWQDDRSMLRPHHDALVITTEVAGTRIERTFVDTGSSVNIMYYDCLKQLDLEVDLQPPGGSLFGFSGEMVVPIGTVSLPVTLGNPAAQVSKIVEFVILDLPNTVYNIILGRPALNT